jgi:hypothetical protein
MDAQNNPTAAPIMVLDAGPAAEGWLHLPSLHAKLLPLAKAAGHDKLHLSCECNGTEPSDYTYLASASGTSANSFRRYISVFEPGGGYSWHDFERVLTAKLQEQATYLQTVKGGQQGA